MDVGVHDHGDSTGCDNSGTGIVSSGTSIPMDVNADSAERYIFAKFQQSIVPHHKSIPLVRTIPTYLTLFIFGFLYELVLVYDSLRLKNTIQVIGLCLYNLGMLIYAAIQYDQINDAITGLKHFQPDSNSAAEDPYISESDPLWAEVQPYLLAVPCIIAFFSVIMGVIAWKLYDEFAWTIYKHISADLRMKRRFLTFQVRFPDFRCLRAS